MKKLRWGSRPGSGLNSFDRTNIAVVAIQYNPAWWTWAPVLMSQGGNGFVFP